MALDDLQHGVLADAEPMANLPVGLAGAYELQYLRCVAIGLDPLAGSAAEHDATFSSSGNAGSHPLAQ
jgi:hypothetical protein